MYNQYPSSSMSYMPYNSISSPTTSGLFGLGKKAFNWNGFLDNAQRTLNVINQAMPIYNQVKPMFRNMGTVFKVIGELNRGTSTNTNNVTSSNSSATNSTINQNNDPQFFA